MASMSEYRQMLAERDLASVWPQWKIVRQLGVGAFGEVYEIQRDEYGRTSKCALKILRRENPVTMSGEPYTNTSHGNTAEEFISTVLREIDIMEKLKGAPNIVVIDDYEVVRNSDSCSVLIRMELLKNLNEFMISRQLTINDIIRIGTDVCSALEYCEGQSIIHRDVKESNIFYSDMGMFKLGDFGISRQLSGYLMNNTVLTSAGTISKMAPEVYRGEKYDNRVDVYSLGIVLYSLLNYGRPPFYPPYPADVSAEAALEADMTRIRGNAIPPLEGIDDELNRIVCKACHPKPSGRYKNAAEFRDALLAYYDAISGLERAPKKKGLVGLLKEKAPEPAPEQMDIINLADNAYPGSAEPDRSFSGSPYPDNAYPYPEQPQEESGSSNLIPGLILIAAILIIVAALVAWYSSQNDSRTRTKSYQPTYSAVDTEPAPDNKDEAPADEQTAEEQAETAKHFLSADWSEEETEEEMSSGAGGGSGLSVNRLEDYVKSDGDSEEILEEPEGVYSLFNIYGDVVAFVSAPEGALSMDNVDGNLIFYSWASMVQYSFAPLASADSYISVMKDAFNSGYLEVDSYSFVEEGSSETDKGNVKWVKVILAGENEFDTGYFGAFNCRGGCISVMSVRLSDYDYPDFPESDFIRDAECVTLAE